MGGRQRVILGMAAVLTAAAGGLVWVGVPDPVYMQPDDASTPAGPDRTTPSLVGSRPARRPSDSSKDPQPADRTRLLVRDDHDWQVRIRACRGRDQRFASARLRTVVYPGFEAAGKPLHTHVLTTNADGEATWRLPTPTEIVTVQVQSADSEVVARPVESVVPVGEKAAVLEVHLFPLDHVLLGVVTTQDSKPVPKARVSWAPSLPPIYTDEQGRFRLRMASSYGAVRYYVVAPGHSRFHETLYLDGPGTTHVSVRLKSGFRVFGKVTDTDGRPLEGVEMRTLWARITGERTLTDADGNYQLDTLDIGNEHHYVVATLDGYSRATGRAKAQGTGQEGRIDLTLERSAVVTGTVFGPDGSPVAGAAVGISRGSRPSGKGTVVTREDGRFELQHPPKGRNYLWTHRRGFAVDRQRIYPTAAGKKVDLQVFLQRGHFVAGRVTDTGGQPVAGARLYAVLDRDAWLRVDVTTGADGRYRLEDLPAQEQQQSQQQSQQQAQRGRPQEGLWLYVSAPGYVTQNKPDLVLDSENIDIVLERSMVLRGRVVDGRTGAPLQDFRIRILKSSKGGVGMPWVGRGQRFQNTDGYWETGRQRIEAGSTFDLEAIADGYAPTVLKEVTATADMAPEATLFKLFPGVSVTGQVLDNATGRPVAGAKISLLRPGQGRGRSRRADNSQRTGAEGTFLFEQVAPGSLLLKIQQTDRPPCLHGPLIVPEAGTIDRVIVLAGGGGRIEGTLMGPDNKPLENVRVTLTPGSMGRYQLRLQTRTTRTDGNGAFHFEGLVNTDYVLYASSEGADGATLVFRSGVRVRGDGPTPVALALQGACSVTGTLGFLGQPGTAVRVQLHRQPDGAGGKAEWQTFGAGVKAGRFTVRGLPEGTYNFATFYQLDGRSKVHNGPKDVVVRAGAANQVSIQVPPPPR